MHPRAFRAFWPAMLALVFASGTSAAAQDHQSLVLPEPDAELQAGLELILRQPAYRRLVQQGRLSVSLVDLSDTGTLRYAGVDDSRERYAASLPKIGILLGVFDQIDKGRLAYTPLLRQKMEGMIRRSDNALSSELIRRVGFPAIAETLLDPKHRLYDEARGGGGEPVA